jgi:hypothetical protein
MMPPKSHHNAYTTYKRYNLSSSCMIWYIIILFVY